MERIEAITAVHHPVRRRIYDYLSLHGTTQVTTLARELGLQVGSVSHHLRMLKRAGVVEQAPDRTGDRRTSWWRSSRQGLSWSADDFSDSPADALLAREAERANVETHVGRLRAWHRRTVPLPEWSRAAFSIDTVAWATPDELAALSAAMRETVAAWQAGLAQGDSPGADDTPPTHDAAHTDSVGTATRNQRMPVFVFAHGFPTVP